MSYKIKITRSVGEVTKIIEFETEDRSLFKEALERETATEHHELKVTHVPLEEFIKNPGKAKLDQMVEDLINTKNKSEKYKSKPYPNYPVYPGVNEIVEMPPKVGGIEYWSRQPTAGTAGTDKW